MDDINADLGPETGDASVQSDRLRPIIRLVRRSNVRWPVGWALAIVAVLAASGLAFGAQMLPALQSGDPATQQMVSQPLSATPVVLDDRDDPTALPTLASEESPTAGPTSPGLEPILSPTDPPIPIPTYVPIGTPASTRTPAPTPPATSHPTLPPTPTPTPTPTATPAPVDMGPLNVTANPDGTYTITWNAYTGPLDFGGYALCYTTNENATFGYVEGFGGVISIGKTTNTWTGTFPWAATLRVKVEALYWPPSSRARKAGETQVVLVYAGGATPAPSTATP